MTATIPWDSYLIRNNVWSYHEDAIVGPTIFSIPAEELFFFIIQTFNTTLLYLLLSKPTFHPVYLRSQKEDAWIPWKWLGASFILSAIAGGAHLIQQRSEGFYLGLILAWAGPFILMLW